MLSKKAEKVLGEFCDYMEQVSPAACAAESFNMGTFFEHNGDDHVHVKDGQSIKTKHLYECGTQACAFGYLAASPIGKRLGIDIVAVVEEDQYYGNTDVSSKFKYNGRAGHPFAIAKKALELSHAQVSFLFGPHDSIDTPANWAKRCRMLMAVKGDTDDTYLLEGVPVDA